MKIIKNDSGVMVLQDRNFFALLLAVPFLTLGLMIIFKSHYIMHPPPAIFSYMAVIVGIFCIIARKVSTVTLDKTSNTLSFLSQNFITKKKEIREYKLDQIDGVQLAVQSKTRGAQVALYPYLAFELKDGRAVFLNPGNFDGGIKYKFFIFPIDTFTRKLNLQRKLGQTIAGFLGVPLQEKDIQTVWNFPYSYTP